MKRAGLVIRMPANWRMNRPSRPSVEATVGSTSPSVLGMDALLDFRVEVSLDGAQQAAAIEMHGRPSADQMRPLSLSQRHRVD